MAKFVHNSWKHEHTKHIPNKLITGINPIASINTPEDSVPAAQEHLKRLIQATVFYHHLGHYYHLGQIKFPY